MNQLMSISDAAALIRGGRYLAVAGDEVALRQLPPGNWIGGTIPYFMGADGGRSSRELVFVSAVPVFAEAPLLRLYSLETLPKLCLNAPDNGYSIVIIPGFSEIHSSFARNAPNYEDMYQKPLIGWISGVHLDELGTATAKVVHGQTGKFATDMAVVMDVPLPAEKYAQIDIVNLFSQGDGDAISFGETSFSAGDCRINGAPANFASYLRDRAIDTRLPLVADYCGAMINVSIKRVDAAAGVVDFYAPVFPGVNYRIARPVPDYVGQFRAALPQLQAPIGFSCNCILNYLYSELEGKRTADITGPITFGEIAYQLLNQTLVYLTIEG